MKVMTVADEHQASIVGLTMQQGFVPPCPCCAEARAALIEEGILCPHPNPGMEGTFTLTETAVSVLFVQGTC